jgi:hypothetical protein
MQTATGTLVAAIQSKEQHPEQRVLADWLQDGSFTFDPGIARDIASDTVEGLGDMGALTVFVESVTPSRSLSTDLPEAAKTDTGFAAADATIILAGSLGEVPLTELFGAYNNPLTAFAPRIGAPVTIDMGMRTSVGVEVLRQFTGKVRACSVDPAAGTVTLACIDSREDFRTLVVLPVIAADDFASLRPSLNAQWVLDYIARKQGYYADPPPRAGCVLLATLHGSVFPEIGALSLAYRYDWTTSRIQGQPLFAALGTGLLGLHDAAGVLLGSTCTSRVIWAPAGAVTPNQGSTMFFEYHRVKVTTTAMTIGPNILQCYAGAIGSTTQVGVRNKAGTSRYEIRVNRAGADSGYLDIGSISFTPGVEHYLAVHITFTATGFDVRVRIDGVTSSVHSGVCGNPTGNAALNLMIAETTTNATQTEATAWVSGLQVTTEAYASTMFNNIFTPTAVFEESYNQLTATPTVDSSDPWVLEQQIADAEQGIFGFDENGVLRFYNRNHLTGGAAVATITTDPSVSFANLIEAASDEAVDTVANAISVPATPLILDQPGTQTWALSEVIGVPAGASITVSAEFPGPVYAISSLPYRAAQAADGTGGDVSNLGVTATQVTASTYNVTITNPNAFDVFLVGNSTVPAQLGDPYLVAVGQCLRPAAESGYTAVRQDAASQARYGVQPLDVAANVWRQSTTAADGLADHLIVVLASPSPTLGGVTIVADPRLQLGDRVRVADPDGLVLDGDFWITALSPALDAGSGYVQSVTCRQA